MQHFLHLKICNVIFKKRNYEIRPVPRMDLTTTKRKSEGGQLEKSVSGQIESRLNKNSGTSVKGHGNINISGAL